MISFVSVAASLSLNMVCVVCIVIETITFGEGIIFYEETSSDRDTIPVSRLVAVRTVNEFFTNRFETATQ